MDCKKCGIELMILERGPLLFENDDRADMPTRDITTSNSDAETRSVRNTNGFRKRRRFILIKNLFGNGRFLYYRIAQRLHGINA